MRKNFALAMIAILALTIALAAIGCGKKTNEGESTTTPTTTTETSTTPDTGMTADTSMHH